MTFIVVLIGWVFSLTLHEFSHALVAYRGIYYLLPLGIGMILTGVAKAQGPNLSSSTAAIPTKFRRSRSPSSPTPPAPAISTPPAS